jgi:spore coat protein H
VGGMDPSGDGDGSGSMGGMGGSAGRLPLGDAVFIDDQILRVDITMDEVLRESLEENGNDEVYLTAAVTVQGGGFEETYSEVGLRHKGNYSLHHCWDENGGVRNHEEECEKLSYKLKFDEFDPNARLDGLKRLNLHSVSGDGSKLRDLIAYETFRSFGIDGPRTVPARLTINGDLLGLFIAVEEIDGRYTKRHYPAGPDGNLYKEIWPRTEFEDQDFVEALETNDDAPDVSDLRAFAIAVENSTQDSFAADMVDFIDIEQTLRYIAVDRAIKNWDGIMAFYQPERPHNFYWYHDDGSAGLFHLVPWDLDNTFWEFDPYMAPEQWATAEPVPDWNETPRNCDDREVWEPGSGVFVTPPRCDPLLDRLAVGHWDEFARLGAELLSGVFALDVLESQVQHWRDLLAVLVDEDPTLDVGEWNDAVDAFRDNLPRLRADFAAFVATGLVEEGEGPELFVPEDLDAITMDAGLHVGGLTNFEFDPITSGEPAGIYVISDEAAAASAFWNEQDPISGLADLRAEFLFSDNPDVYDEWMNVGITTAATNVSGFSSIVMTLRSDIPRTVRVRVASGAYETEWGDIWDEFGQYYQVDTEPTEIIVRFGDLEYPDWAKNAWEAEQGFTTSDAEALALALTVFTGLIFNPEPSWDDVGVLPTETESGFLQIDNIYFR